MRKILLGLFILLVSSTCYGQLKLRYGGQPTIQENSVRRDDTLHVSYWLVNISSDSSKLNANISTRLTTNKTQDSSSTGPIQDTFVFVIKGDSVQINAQFKVTDTIFKKGEDCIVVIWPTGDGTENLIGKKAIDKKLFVNYALSVQPSKNDLNRVSIYPNPLRSTATIKLSSPQVKIQHVYVTNLQGETISSPVVQNGQIDLGYLKEGLYLLQIQFTDGSRSVYRITKQ